MSVFIRKAIQNLLEEIDSNKIRNTLKKLIHTQIKETMETYMDRVIKLVIKALLASESANYNTSELLSSISKVDRQEIRQIAYRNAIEYLKKEVRSLSKVISKLRCYNPSKSDSTRGNSGHLFYIAQRKNALLYDDKTVFGKIKEDDCVSTIVENLYKEVTKFKIY